jgi:hypothetical protein
MPVDENEPEGETFNFRGGSTLIFDMDGEEPTLRYAITRPIGDKARLEATQAYRRGRGEHGVSLSETYFGAQSEQRRDEPFCFLHDHGD